jgi:hypothetical protein
MGGEEGDTGLLTSRFETKNQGRRFREMTMYDDMRDTFGGALKLVFFWKAQSMNSSRALH